ncbi:MAG TPA: hypothetical protein DCX64_00940, partial [Gammaproteobacteria bacterium]|nr:hypothetical protein [Gammaproteobacteria bacterium]
MPSKVLLLIFNIYYSPYINKKNLEKKISNFISTEIEWIPLNSVKVPKEKNEGLINFFDSLE